MPFVIFGICECYITIASIQVYICVRVSHSEHLFTTRVDILSNASGLRCYRLGKIIAMVKLRNMYLAVYSFYVSSCFFSKACYELSFICAHYGSDIFCYIVDGLGTSLFRNTDCVIVSSSWQTRKASAFT